MALIPLKIPAGFYRTGTELDASGRWRDGSLVRWRDGSLRPIGGWRVNENIASITTNAPRGMHTWESNNGTRYVAAGSYNELFAVVSGGTAYNIAPTDLVSGSEDAAVNIGYGYGLYGAGTYGTPRPDTGNLVEATTWSLDNWGQNLIACSIADRRLLEWSLGPTSKAAVIANSPSVVNSTVVTEERFIFALGSTSEDPAVGFSPRLVRWCDREDNTVWTASPTNQAGEIQLQTSGQIETAIRTRGQTLIITDIDAHTARYIGPPYVYGFERVGTSCGIISRQAAADVDMGVFWMGNGGFYRFDGNLVSEIPCDVHDYVFNDINTSQKSKTWAFTNGQFGEIWWFYCSSNSTEIDRYVALDYKENHWLIGNLSRTSGASRGVFEYPMLMDANGAMYDHEVGLSYAVSGTEQSIFAESGPISIGNGDNIMQVTDLIPDEKTQGDVDVTFKSRFYPNDTEYTHGPYTPSSPTAVRFSGRQIRMRVEGDAPYAAWRVGTMRVDAKQGGRR